jgi:dTDP-4-dehydrorhamnose reductase
VKIKKVLVLGVSGMLGHKLFFELSKDTSLDVYGTQRSSDIGIFSGSFASKIKTGVDGDNFDTIIRALASIQPDVVINCIGLIKQTALSNDPLTAITVNAQLPHRISLVCKASGARMIHFSTDCIFDGKKGEYKESDISSATDLYGRTKFLGEVDYPHCLTIRTSIIGHELKGFLSLVEWFLRQNSANGYSKAIFSGLPTVEIAKVLREYILPNDTLCGVYHLSTDAISKYDLLTLINKRYEANINIERFDDFYIDRSLDSSKFSKQTSYVAPKWEQLIEDMYIDYKKCDYYIKEEEVC